MKIEDLLKRFPFAPAKYIQALQNSTSPSLVVEILQRDAQIIAQNERIKFLEGTDTDDVLVVPIS